MRVLLTKQEINFILHKALQSMKSSGKVPGALKVWLSLDSENYDVSQARCTSVINLINKHVHFCKGRTYNENVPLLNKYIEIPL